MHKLIRILIHSLVFVFLTAITQIGGLIYLFVVLLFTKKSKARKWKRLVLFFILYLSVTFLIVPFLAPEFGRQKLSGDGIRVYNSFYVLCNRNYVGEELNEILMDISEEFRKDYPEIELIVLDANFPFIDGFPLLPHLSHKDGKKVDLAFIYKKPSGAPVNDKISRLGYGAYENPSKHEFNQTIACKNQGAWQYDFPKYLSFGRINKDLDFAPEANRKLIEVIANHPNVQKVFVEPHLKTRLELKSSKIRFQGCHSVRHDDHIHLQIK
jgi:hypothetical protein